LLCAFQEDKPPLFNKVLLSFDWQVPCQKKDSARIKPVFQGFQPKRILLHAFFDEILIRNLFLKRGIQTKLENLIKLATNADFTL
jgi:hypothetical protein